MPVDELLAQFSCTIFCIGQAISAARGLADERKYLGCSEIKLCDTIYGIR